MAGSPWHIIWSPAIPWLQVICVLAGTAYTFQTLIRCWRREASRRPALLGSLPLGAFVWSAAAGMTWFFAG